MKFATTQIETGPQTWTI